MKVDELEIGKIYKCVLSKQEVLVVEGEKITKEATKKTAAETETVTAGKVCVTREGIPNFLHLELHDGQLEAISNN